MTLRIGCPVWAHGAWRGHFFTPDARREQFLPQYASVFATAEGNSTFYGLPASGTVQRWADEAPAGFRFCFKFPRVISHDRQLLEAEAETQAFLHCVAPLQGRLGPCFLQLHESFGPARLPMLADYLQQLPSEFEYAVEVRHRDFFDSGRHEQALNALLEASGVDRVVFDTRCLFASRADDPHTRDAKAKKPRVPVRFTAVGRRPFVRFVADPQLTANSAALRSWANVVVNWLREGRSPYFFVHHPDDLYAPDLAAAFQAQVHALAPELCPKPAAWPVASERSREQLELF